MKYGLPAVPGYIRPNLPSGATSEIAADTHFILPEFSDHNLPFWDDRLGEGWDDLLVNSVFNTLVSGYAYLSSLPGLETLSQEHSRDPEVRR